MKGPAGGRYTVAPVMSIPPWRATDIMTRPVSKAPVGQGMTAGRMAKSPIESTPVHVPADG